ncbi:MAG: glycoside hydrolase family 18 protein [Pirellulales bacterium]
MIHFPIAPGLTILLLFMSCSPSISLGQVAAPEKFRVVGYLPDYRASEFDPGVIRKLTDLMIFSAEPSREGELDLQRVEGFPWQLILAQKTLHRTRVVLTVGGWDRSEAFAAISAFETTRTKFAQACVQTCLEKRLDGIDIDWEHPQGADQTRHYGLLLETLNKQLKSHGLTLSVTVAAWQQLDPLVLRSVDWIHVMAYDHPKKHSTLENARADVETLIKAGADRNRITLGVPFYGRKVDQPDQVRTYRDLLNHAGKTVVEGDEYDGYYFNGPATIRRKTDYAKSTGLAGVMIWELGQDAQGSDSLLEVIVQTAAQRR